MSNSPETYNLTNELAKERNRAAAERTLMAWIRTSLSLISFGFGIDRVVTALNKQDMVAALPTRSVVIAAQNTSLLVQSSFNTLRLSRILGLTFIAIGTLSIIIASFNHRQDLHNIAQGRFTYLHRPSLSLIVSNALVLAGLFAFIGILLDGG